MTAVKTFIVGDIHGCFEEFLALLDKAALAEDDQIIALGDLVNRGPQSARTLDFFRQHERPNLRSIIGNHEQRHIHAFRGETRPTISTLYTRWQLGDSYDEAVAYMESLPVFIELPEALLVHAYYEPNVALEDQKPDMLIGGKGMEEYLRANYDRPWYEYYEGDRPLIVGHRDWSGTMHPFIHKDRVYGIDTRCVYGGSLTGIILPDFQFVSVPAKHDHFARFRKRYVNDAD
jgi:serine/threonine protein phosphatase 1